MVPSQGTLARTSTTSIFISLRAFSGPGSLGCLQVQQAGSARKSTLSILHNDTLEHPVNYTQDLVHKYPRSFSCRVEKSEMLESGVFAVELASFAQVIILLIDVLGL